MGVSDWLLFAGSPIWQFNVVVALIGLLGLPVLVLTPFAWFTGISELGVEFTVG
jgi:hypothetical protein